VLFFATYSYKYPWRFIQGLICEVSPSRVGKLEVVGKAGGNLAVSSRVTFFQPGLNSKTDTKIATRGGWQKVF